MQTIFPKLAGIVLTICAVAFMGLSIAAYFGRPDPFVAMSAPEVDNYKFGATAGEKISWTTEQVVGGQGSKQFETPYAAVLAAYKMEETRLNTSASELSDLATSTVQKINVIRAQQEIDGKALQSRIVSLEDGIQKLAAERQRLSGQLQGLMVSAKDVRNETTDRREDVMRLQTELDELRTDKFRMEETQRILTDRLLRLQLQNQALDIRKQQFQALAAPAAE